MCLYLVSYIAVVYNFNFDLGIWGNVSEFHTNLNSLCHFVYGENLHNLIHDNEIVVKKCTTILDT